MMLDRCPWYVAGPLLGLLIVGLRLTVNKPLGALGGYIDVAEYAGGARRMGFGAFLLVGIVLGGALFANLAGTSSSTWLYGEGSALPVRFSGQIILLVAAGIAMGVGARTAGGCTSGHGLSGASLGSPASLMSTMTFFLTAVALAHVFTWLLGATS